MNESLPIELFSDDVFLVSYPKSGRTWLRFLIGNYLSANVLDFPDSYQDLVTDIDANPLQGSQVCRPRFITSHRPFTSAYNRVLYVVRDGRDVAVSYYFHLLKFKVLTKETKFEDFVRRIFDIALYGNITWSNHVNLWLDNAPSDFLLLRYEDIQGNTVDALTRILEFAGLSVDRRTVITSVEASKFEKLQEYERVQERINYKDIKDSDFSIKFFRSGQIGEYKKFFDDKLLGDFLKVHGSALERLGYLT